MINNMESDLIDHFRQDTEGFYGSKTLWESVKGYETFWNALEIFLDKTG